MSTSILSLSLALAACSVASTTAHGQDHTWVESPVTGHWYAWQDGLTWNEAEAIGQAWGGHLVAMQSASENSWVFNQFYAGTSPVIYIGLSRNGGWNTWTTGEPVTYENWQWGEPNGGATYPRAVMAYNPEWKDWWANTPQAAVFEVVSDDCDENGIPDVVEIIAHPNLDTDSNGVLDICEDCNGNGVPDGTDIQQGDSEDCNANGLPDECDIRDGTAPDCNANGVPDECELTGNDCDSNGVPDECDPDLNGNGVPDTCDCVTANYCLAAANSNGTAAQVGSNGQTVISDNSFVLTVQDAMPIQFGVFFYGANQQQLIWGEGMLCVLGPLYRLQPIVLTDATGAASYAMDFTLPPASGGPGAIDPFSTWNFQYWYRDPVGGPAGFNFSDGLEVTFCP